MAGLPRLLSSMAYVVSRRTAAAVSSSLTHTITGAQGVGFVELRVRLIASRNLSIRRMGIDGLIVTAAGNCTVPGYSGDGGAGVDALLWTPFGATTDGAGGVVWSEQSNHVLRRLDSDGIVYRVAGNGARGFSGDGDRSAEAVECGGASHAAHSLRLPQRVCCAT